jgi:uncharacterized protein YecA (UPF0149 family)
MSEKQQSYPYDPPVADLLTAGDPRGQAWLDYPAAYAFTKDHTPDLIRMMQDEELNQADSDSDEVWAPLHAWRALGQLGDPAAVEAIAALFPRIDDEWNSDWEQEELPVVLGMIGSPAIPALEAFLANPQNGLFARAAAATALVKIGQQDTAVREECIAVLVNQLRQHERQEVELNGFIINDLVELRAVEVAAVMEAAFQADSVDLSILGDWEDVQIMLGLSHKRSTPAPVFRWVRDEAAFEANKSGEKRADQTVSQGLTDGTRTTVPKAGRNDPCPCGSGIKYKKCHGKLG